MALHDRHSALKHEIVRKYAGKHTPMHAAIAREQIFFVILVSIDCRNLLSILKKPNKRIKSVLSSNMLISEWFRSFKVSQSERSTIRANLLFTFFSLETFLALETSAPEIFSQLIAIFADSIVQRNNSELTALSIAILKGHLGAVQIIVARKPECLNERYDTPFFVGLNPAEFAAMFEQKDIEEYLADYLMEINGLTSTFVYQQDSGEHDDNNEKSWDL